MSIAFPTAAVGIHPQREKWIRQSIDGLSEQQRASMAKLILSGYTFLLGNVYWRCRAPGEPVRHVAALDTLPQCIHQAEQDYENTLWLRRRQGHATAVEGT